MKIKTIIIIFVVYLFSGILYLSGFFEGRVLAEEIEDSIKLSDKKPKSMSLRQWKKLKGEWVQLIQEWEKLKAEALQEDGKGNGEEGKDNTKIPDKKPEGMSDLEWEKMKAKKPLPFDKGPSMIDISKYPRNMQDIYNNVFLKTCSKCHTIARPINAPYALAEEWKKYIKKMMKKPGSGINPRKAKEIYKFLVYDSKIRKQDLIKKKLEAKDIIIMPDKKPEGMSDKAWEKMKTEWEKLKTKWEEMKAGI